MYLLDYGTTELLLEDRRRDAARHRAHAELVRQARGITRQQNPRGFLNSVKRLVYVRNQPQKRETGDVRRATAV